MREILFRSKRVDNGEWETGSLVVTRMWCSDESVFIADKMTGVYTPVDSKTVGQYTGLTDKNGTRIFEGDIVKQEFSKLRQSTNGICEFHNGSFGLKIKVLGIERFFPFACICNSTYEVIGNIHDNPELLKGE